jgi:hypothetical protein
MAKQVINIGTMADNKSGDPLRTAFTKVNENFTELYNRPVGANLSAVSTDILPDVDVTRDLGSPTKRFKDLYLSGNTIDLGGAKISADLNGNVAIPGINELKFKPHAIIDGRQDGELYYNDVAVQGEVVVIDQVAYQMAMNPNLESIRPQYLYSAYIPTINEAGFITDITVAIGEYYPETSWGEQFEIINTDNMWIIPGTVDAQNWAQVADVLSDPINSGAQLLRAGVSSISEAVTTPIPMDISELTDTTGLLGNSPLSTGIAQFSFIDLAKSVNILTDGEYSMGDGLEGQLLYVVCQTGTTNPAAIKITLPGKCRIQGVEYTGNFINPFAGGWNMVQFLYTDGAWQSLGGVWD